MGRHSLVGEASQEADDEVDDRDDEGDDHEVAQVREIVRGHLRRKPPTQETEKKKKQGGVISLALPFMRCPDCAPGCVPDFDALLAEMLLYAHEHEHEREHSQLRLLHLQASLQEGMHYMYCAG